MTDERAEKVEIRTPDGKYWSTIEEGDDGIVYLKSVGFQDLEYSTKVRDALLAIGARRGSCYRLCFDMTEFDDASPEGRQVMDKALRGEDSPLEMLGTFGGSFFARQLFNMYGLISKIPVRGFDNEEETRDWLRNGVAK